MKVEVVRCVLKELQEPKVEESGESFKSLQEKFNRIFFFKPCISTGEYRLSYKDITTEAI